MADAFKPGDVVRLKSGGPHMTVTGMIAGSVGVAWFDGKVLMQTEINRLLPPDTLERVP